MKINNIKNINFTRLKGFSDPKTAETFRDLSIKYGKDFAKMANGAFENISAYSDEEDVFIKFRTYENEYGEEKINAVITDSKGETVTDTFIDCSDNFLSPQKLYLHFECLIKQFKKNFKSHIPLENIIDRTIDKFS